MQPTGTGQNRTGAASSAKNVDLMLKAVDDLSPPRPIDTSQMEEERHTYVTDAEGVGSIPPMVADTEASAGRKKKKKKVVEADLSLFLDKLGERLAFERTGTRLYDALIVKYQALIDAGHDVLPPAPDDDEDSTAEDTLRRIRAEELAHFQLLSGCVAELGGDPTAQTPCADVAATASIGLMQVVTDPRTTLAQSLNAMLTAELTDTAGWELLAQLADHVGQEGMARTFLRALEAEQAHLEAVRQWLEALLTNEAGTPAV
jgi:rubrerythrin